MPERSSERKARINSVSSSLGEPETSSLRKENIPSISEKDFSELSEKTEKSAGRRIKDTEVGQKEILRMVKNLSSKIDSSLDKTPPTVSTNTVEPDLTEPGPSSQREDSYELPQGQGQHMVTRVTVPQEIPTRKSSLPFPNQKYSDDIVNKLLESLIDVTQQNLGLPRLPKELSINV